MWCQQVKVIDEKRYKKTYEDIMKKLDRIENEYLPQIKLDKTEVSSRFSVEAAFSNNKHIKHSKKV